MASATAALVTPAQASDNTPCQIIEIFIFNSGYQIPIEILYFVTNAFINYILFAAL